MTFQNPSNAVLHDDYLVKLTGALNGALLFNNNDTLGFINPSTGVPFWNGSGYSWVQSLSPSGNAGGVLAGQYPNPDLAPNAVSFASIQNISSGRILGRVSAGSGIIESLTVAQIQTLLSLANAAYRTVGVNPTNLVEVLAGGKIDPSIIPAMALGSFQTVANNASKLALTGLSAGETTVRVLVDETRGNKASTYGLMALPSSLESNWILLSDEQVDAGDIVSGIISPDRLGTNAGSASRFLNGLGDYTTVPSGVRPITVITASNQITNLAVNQRYICNFGSRLTLPLPVNAAVGDTISVYGYGSGGWRIGQNAGQGIKYLRSNTTPGVGGYIETEHTQTQSQAGCVDLVCTATNNSWLVTNAVGAFNVV